MNTSYKSTAHNSHKASNNFSLDNHTIYFALFFTQLTAIIAQASLRSSVLEMVMQILIWGILLGIGLTFGWSSRPQTQNSLNKNTLNKHANANNKPDSKLPEQLTNGATFIGILAFMYQLLNGDLTAGLLLMLSWLLVGLGFSLKQQRSLYFALAASTVLLLYAASISMKSSFIIYIIIYTLAAIIVLAGNFYLSKTKQSIATVAQQKPTDFPLKLPITLLVTIILLITSSLYLLVPRPDAMHWGSFPAGGGRYQSDEDWPQNDPKEQEKNDKSVSSNKNASNKEDSDVEQMNDHQEGDAFSYSGFNDELSINEASGKQNHNRLILYMEGKEPQYLRGNIYDHFDGLSWKTTHQTKKRIEREDNRFEVNPDLKGPFQQYTITMAANIAGKPNLFVPADTAELQFPGNAIAQDNYGALFSPATIQEGTFYSVKIEQKSHKLDGRPVEPITTGNMPSESELKRYKQLPKNLSDKFFDFSETISKDSESVIQKAGKIEQFLRKNYEYSLESVYSSQGKIPLEEFLFERPLGHCEYFATAMVTLMRAQDIPARLVTGFSVTKYNPVTGYYEARSLDAHAWAEVWDPKTGWVTFEATPPYTLPTPSNAQNTSQSIEEYLQQRSDDAELTDPTSIATALLNTAKDSFQTFNILLEKAWKGIKQAVVWGGTMLLHYGWLMLILFALVFAAIHYLRYYLVHLNAKKQLQKASKKLPRQQLETSYRIMESIFSQYRHPRHEGLTIQQYQAYLSTQFPKLSNEINTISENLNTDLYDQFNGTKKKSALTALKNAQKIVEYKFRIPRPAEKQIQALQKLFKELPFIKTKEI